jgi:hypothetical protein
MAGCSGKCKKCDAYVTAPRLSPISTPASTASTPQQSAPQQKACPFCSELILATAKKCKHCGEFLDGSRSVVAATPPIAQMIREGHFAFSCPYDQAYAIVERAMSECEVQIKERSPEKGLLMGKCKPDIRSSGITVTCIFYSDAGMTQAEVTATQTVFGLWRQWHILPLPPPSHQQRQAPHFNNRHHPPTLNVRDRVSRERP